jgi:hypothetical protein
MKLHRSAADAPEKGLVTILGRNPEAIWFSGYNDRVIYDEAGLFTNAKNDEDTTSNAEVEQIEMVIA